MPLPIIPIIAIGVSTCFAALSIKRALDAKKVRNKSSKNNAFAQFAYDQRLKEKAAHKFMLLQELKTEIINNEYSRCQIIFENILHSGVIIEKVNASDYDWQPFVAGANSESLQQMEITLQFYHASLVQLQADMRGFNHSLQEVVMRAGIDYRKYSKEEKEIFHKSVQMTCMLQKGLKIKIFDEKGQFRTSSFEEIEELVLIENLHWQAA
jgi:hypothetical protein